MRASTELAISLGSIFGFIFLILSLAFARFSFRKHSKGRATPVDPVYESELNEGQTRKGKKWFGGGWGLTPVAEPGKNGTKQYLSGWFALDGPTGAGWTASDADGTFSTSAAVPTEEGSQRSWRESHFSRASRASKRSKRGKGPRPSRTTELGMMEGNRSEGEGAKVEEKEERVREEEERKGLVEN